MEIYGNLTYVGPTTSFHTLGRACEHVEILGY